MDNRIIKCLQVALLALYVTLPKPLLAQRLIPFQGIISTSSEPGAQLLNTNKVVQFQIYDQPTEGLLVWSGEVHNLTVNKGLVNTVLGSKNPFPFERPNQLGKSFFDGPLYLQITVDSNGDGQIDREDAPMLPRQVILPVPFAVTAGNTEKLAGYDWSVIFGENNPLGVIPGSRIALESISPDKLSRQSLTTNELAKALMDLLVPPGTIVAFGGETNRIPSGWLLCDGTPVLVEDFPQLYSAISTNWGDGGYHYPDYTPENPRRFSLGSAFNLPDLRGLFLRGVSGSEVRQYSDFQMDPDKFNRISMNPGGNTTNRVGSLQIDQLRSHTHINGPFNVLMQVNSQATSNGQALDNIGAEPNLLTSAEMLPFGGNENRPFNAYVHYIIKY